MAQVCETLVKADGSSLKKQCNEFELPCTTYIAQQHDIKDTTRNSDNGKAKPLNAPGAQEAEDDIQQLTHALENNTQGLREQMYNSNEVTQRCPQRYVSPTSKYTNYLRDMRNNIMHMVFEG